MDSSRGEGARYTRSADYDGDGRATSSSIDRRTGTGSSLTRVKNTCGVSRRGVSTDIPVSADYDGDRRVDIAIYRPSNGIWWVLLIEHVLHGLELRTRGGEGRHIPVLRRP